MKLKKWIVGLIAMLGLATFGGVSAQHIHAMPSINSQRGMQYWFKTRHVRAKYGFRAILIHDSDPEAYSYKVGSRYIKKGTPLYVNYRGIEWAWTLNNHYFNGRKIGYYAGHDYWVAGGGSSKWAPYRAKRIYHKRRAQPQYKTNLRNAVNHWKRYRYNSRCPQWLRGYWKYNTVKNYHLYYEKDGVGKDRYKKNYAILNKNACLWYGTYDGGKKMYVSGFVRLNNNSVYQFSHQSNETGQWHRISKHTYYK